MQKCEQLSCYPFSQKLLISWECYRFKAIQAWHKYICSIWTKFLEGFNLGQQNILQPSPVKYFTKSLIWWKHFTSLGFLQSFSRSSWNFQSSSTDFYQNCWFLLNLPRVLFLISPEFCFFQHYFLFKQKREFPFENIFLSHEIMLMTRKFSQIPLFR